MIWQLPGLYYRFRKLQRSQWATEKALQQAQLRKVQFLVRHAWDHVRFHRRRFEAAGFHPDQFESLDDLHRIPVTDKSSLVPHDTKERVADNIPRPELIPLSTAGSTGHPLNFVISRSEKYLRVMNEWRALSAHGARVTDKVLQFRNTKHVYRDRFWFQKLGLMRRMFVHFGDPIQDKIRIIEEWKPTLLQAYPSVLLDIMTHMSEAQIRRLPLRYLVSCGEVLDSHARQLIESAFQIPLIDHFGAMEFGYLAWQCPEFEGLHLNEDAFLFEILRDGEPVDEGEEGEIVVTSLDQQAMPFIRYRLGDRARLLGRHCPCGRSLASIDVLMGRTTDRILRRDGSEVNPHLFHLLYHEVRGLFQYQIIQRAADRFRVRFVPLRHAESEPLKRRFQEKINEIMGYPVEIEFNVIDRFAPDETGKLKLVQSEIGSPITSIAPSIRDQVFLDSVALPTAASLQSSRSRSES
jgi:phenylacetate-CoA ligase